MIGGARSRIHSKDVWIRFRKPKVDIEAFALTLSSPQMFPFLAFHPILDDWRRFANSLSAFFSAQCPKDAGADLIQY